MTPDPTQKVFDYIALLESTIDQLLATLKQCVTLLAQFTDSVPDPQSWQEMLDVLQEAIKAGGGSSRKRTCTDLEELWWTRTTARKRSASRNLGWPINMMEVDEVTQLLIEKGISLTRNS